MHAKHRRLFWVIGIICFAGTLSGAEPSVPKWSRFEHAFESTAKYQNPVQDATLTVSFRSPRGETNLVDGFWDGGNIWRVRFSPNVPGQWSWTATCSDTQNRGLHQKSGTFLCAAPTGRTAFEQHGPVRVAT